MLKYLNSTKLGNDPTLIMPCALLMLVLFGWSISSPIGSSPDEAFHISSIWCPTSAPSANCIEASETETREKLIYLPFVIDTCFNASLATSSACSSTGRPTSQLNRANSTLNPPGFYQVMHRLVTSDPTTSIVIMRISNSLIAVFCFAMVLKLSNRKIRTAFIVSWFVTLSPRGISLIASVNPSSWAIIAGTTNWAFLLTIITAPRKSSKQLLAGMMWLFTLLLAFNSRFDGFFGVLATCLIALFAHYGINIRSIRRFTPWILVAILCVFSLKQARETIGLFVFLSNSVNTYPDRSLTQWFIFNIVHVIEIPLGAWGGDWGAGGIKSFDISPPPLVSVIGFGLCIATLTFSFQKSDRKQILVFLASSLLIFLPVFQMLYHWRFLIGDMVTTRYILPVMPFLIGISIYTSNSVCQLIDGKRAKIVLISLTSIGHSLALFTILQRYVSGNDGFYRLIDTTGGWWWQSMPFGPNLVWLVGSSALPLMMTSWAKSADLQ